MIAQIRGKLVARDLDRVEVLTGGGVGYVLAIPLSVYEGLPRLGEEVTLHTHLVVREDAWLLYGFATAFERRVFERVLGSKGIGPQLGLNLLSTLSAERLVRAIREKDLAALQQVKGLGRKRAEQLILDLAEKLDDVQVDTGGAPRPAGAGVDDAIRALQSLGYTGAEAEKAVRAALDAGGKGKSVPELIRLALTKVGGK
jgi:Holliday junction DNA helicase RuvA